jgi:hypothetical protein
MNKTIKRKWLAALRSGAYDQTAGYLHVYASTSHHGLQPGYCCLGVLCDIAVAEGIVSRMLNDRSGIVSYGASTETGVLPREVYLWAGLTDDNPVIGDDSRPLSGLNDEWKTFPEIADLIDQYL